MPRSPKATVAEPGGPGEVTHGRSSEPPSDDDEDDEILETSENGRWQKINEHVTRDVPGIDAAFLAMDTDDGVEVVWNEVRYSNRKIAKGSKDRLVKILQRLTEVKHNNIVDFIDFWHDKVDQQDRLVFITEYMTSGSLMQFLKKAKRTKKTVSEKMWRRWCRQILSALSYLHKNDIVHGNLSLASIFIQHNGLVKIGSVSPDAIHEHVKTKIEGTKRMHYTAPEYAGEGPIRTSADIYAFGICALEMLNFDLLGNGDGRPSPVKQEAIQRALEGLTEPKRLFIQLCLQDDPGSRPKAVSLLKHHVLQEVFSLKVLSVLALSQRISREKIEAELDQRSYSQSDPEAVLAELPHTHSETTPYRASQAPQLDVDKFFEEIMLDVPYHNDPLPFHTHSTQKKDDSISRAAPPSSTSSNERSSTQFYERETRTILDMNCEVRRDGEKRELFLRLNFGDKMQRELTSELKDEDEAAALAFDLVVNGLVSEGDKERVSELILQKMQTSVVQ